MRRTALPVALALALGAAAPAVPVAASDHEPPRTFLMARDKTQRGRLGTYCWIKRSFPGFIGTCVDGLYPWPKAKKVRAASEAVVFLEKALPPEELSLHSWREIGRYGYPKGRGKDLAFVLTPAVRAGQPGWAAAFTLPKKPGHYYLSVFGRWTDEEGSFADQDANWAFHLKLRPSVAADAA